MLNILLGFFLVQWKLGFTKTANVCPAKSPSLRKDWDFQLAQCGPLEATIKIVIVQYLYYIVCILMGQDKQKLEQKNLANTDYLMWYCNGTAVR